MIRVDAYLDDMSPMANSTISFLTGENDGGKGGETPEENLARECIYFEGVKILGCRVCIWFRILKTR